MAFLAALLLQSGRSAAGTIDRADVTHHSGRYTIALDVTLDAPYERIIALLSDDSRLPEISPAVVSSRVLAVHGPTERRRLTVVRSCVLFFCFEFVAEEDIRVLGAGRIHTRIDPARSDFRFGESLWVIAADGAHRTRVVLNSAREPAFWIPPAIGPWLLERQMRRELRQSMQRLERLAGQDPAGGH